MLRTVFRSFFPLRRALYTPPTNIHRLHFDAHQSLPDNALEDLASKNGVVNGKPVGRSYSRVPNNISGYENKELSTLREYFQSSVSRVLFRSEVYDQFIGSLFRQYSIETAAIENLIRVDRRTAQSLIETGFLASVHSSDRDRPRVSESDVEPSIGVVNTLKMLADQEGALRDAWQVITGRSSTPSTSSSFPNVGLSTHALTEFHKTLTRHQTSPVGDWRGRCKTVPNYVAIGDGSLMAFCPPEKVQSELENMVTMYESGIKHQSAEVAAAWLHMNFIRIHPFTDGNGRLARFLASLVLIKGQECGFPLLLRKAGDQTAYYNALGAGDAGNLQPLADLIAHRQVAVICQALQAFKGTHIPSIANASLKLALAVCRSLDGPLSAFCAKANTFLERCRASATMSKFDSEAVHKMISDAARDHVLPLSPSALSIGFTLRSARRESRVIFAICESSLGVNGLFAMWQNGPVILRDFAQFNHCDSAEEIAQRVTMYVDTVLTRVRHESFYSYLTEAEAEAASEGSKAEELGVWLEQPCINPIHLS